MHKQFWIKECCYPWIFSAPSCTVRQIPLAQAEYSWLGGSLCKLGQWCGIPCLWHLWEYSVHSLVTRLNFHEVFYQHSCTPLFVCMHKRHIYSLWWTMHVSLPHCGGLIQYIYFFSIAHSHKSMQFFERPTTKQNITHPNTAISNTFSDSMTSCPVGCGLSWPVFCQWAAKKAGKINSRLPSLNLTPGFCVFLLLHNCVEMLWAMEIQQQQISSNPFFKVVKETSANKSQDENYAIRVFSLSKRG